MSISPELLDSLGRIDGLELRSDLPGSALSTFRLGGRICCLLEVGTLLALSKALSLLEAAGQYYRVLGNGSNVLLPDDGVNYPVIHFARNWQKIIPLTVEISDDSLVEVVSSNQSGAGSGLAERMFVSSGVSLMSLSRNTAEQGLSGLEFAAGIPASFGGALCMNAGAHGAETCSVVCRVVAVNTRTAEVCCFSREACQYGYRHSLFQGQDYIIAGAELLLVQAGKDEVVAKRSSCLEYRRQTQPLSLPSCGSVFRNPGSNFPSAGALIEQAGLKGYRIGGVIVSPLHANWIVKVDDDALAEDVVRLISHIQEEVLKREGIKLQCEIDCWRMV